MRCGLLPVAHHCNLRDGIFNTAEILRRQFDGSRTGIFIEALKLARARNRAMDVSPLDGNLQDAVVRLVRLLDSKAKAVAEVAGLMPLITLEIINRLLIGEQGAWLRHLAMMGGAAPLIARAVERLRDAALSSANG